MKSGAQAPEGSVRTLNQYRVNMLRFNTQFTVDFDKDINLILEAAYAWLHHSQHYAFNFSNLESLKNNSIEPYRIGNESVSAAHCKTDVYEGIGFKHENTDKNYIRWITEIVGAKFDGKFWINVQLSCDSATPQARLPVGKKPYIVRLLFEKFGAGYDSNFSITEEPLYLSDTDDDFTTISEVILGDSENLLPVVYVSINKDDKYEVDPKQLAKWLSGMAHTIVEPNRDFSFDLKKEVNAKNVYLGTVGIYWPDGGVTRLFPGGKFKSSHELASEVSKLIRNSLVTQRTIKECSWSHLRELVSRAKINDLKEGGSTELQKYVDAFDEELSAKEEQLKDAEGKLAKLRAELSGMHRLESHNGYSLLEDGEEQDLYAGERKDLIIELLSSALDQSQPNTRRRDIIKDIIHANKPVGIRQELMDSVKDTFRQYKSMDKKVSSSIETMGFELLNDGKHYKLKFKSDSRYTVSVAKTSSDHRSGLNLASQIKSNFF